MFRRVRSKLIFWLLLVTIGSMIPLAVFPYFSVREISMENGKNRLRQVLHDFKELSTRTTDNLKSAAKLVTQDLNARLVENPSLKHAFRESDKAVLENLERQLTATLHSLRLYRGMEVHLLSIEEFRDLDQKAYRLYETEDGDFLLWVYSELTSEEMSIGGFVVGQVLMSQREEVIQSAESQDNNLPTELRTIRSYTPEWTPRSPYGVQIDIIDPKTPWILNNEFIQSPEFQELVEGESLQVYASNVKINRNLSQAFLIQFKNQRGEVSGIIILSVPRLEPLWGFIWTHALRGILISILFAVTVAVFVARSIANPINRLTRTAKQMARGDLTARVEVSSKDEVGQLASSFNDMAGEVERSHTELATRAQELEDSIRLLNATNRELTRTQNHLENILVNIRSGVVVIDNVGRIVRANRAAQEILGLTEPPDADYREVLGYEEFGQLVEDSLHKGISVFQREIAWNKSQNIQVPLQVSTVPLLDGGRITGLVVTFHDLSNIRKLEKQLVLQDRLAALGRLSAGLAHEIRNPLGVIKGAGELLRKRFGGLPGEEGLCDFILEEVARLSRVVSDFLNFARPPIPELEKIDVNTVIRRSFQYLEHQKNESYVRQEFDLAHNLPPLDLDPNLFQQVLLNIFLNAQEAMPKGGTIRVRTRRMSPRNVAVEVEDTGVGIPSESLQNIFDPFFTSKDNGTGLGLSVVHQIISGHGGQIEVDSHEGAGTIFRIVLPVNGEKVGQPKSSSVL